MDKLQDRWEDAMFWVGKHPGTTILLGIAAVVLAVVLL